MSRRRSSLFLHVRSPPSPDAHPTLWEHRLRQRRTISRNPFEDESVPTGEYGNTVIGSPEIQGETNKFEEAQVGSDHDEFTRAKGNYDIEWGEQVPSWLNLFFDLAWTATFSSLTSNNKFREPWDSISYTAFFITAWWLWVAQVAYNVDFYTDDWFHLLFTFLQLLIFGALAATTRGYDVTNYILHSPGSSDLEPYNIMTVGPDRYAAEHLTKTSLRVITFVVALSRILLLVQHLRVLVYAKLSCKKTRFPRRLLIVPTSLIISAGLFVAAFMTTLSGWGLQPGGAKIKYACWGSAVLVEMVAHTIMFQLDAHKGIRLRSHGSVTGRLADITTILLGEGLNAIAGTFYAIEQAPGFSAPTGSAVVCCAIIVFFLAYLYFEGAAPLKSVRRRAAWIMMHLPWLLSVILLLEAGLFVAAFMTTLSDWGRQPNGARVKYACWGSAILVEMIAHIIMFQLDVNQGIRLRSHGSVTGRLSDITTILLGEGINAIAGTFYAIEQAPGFSAPTGSAVVCCGVIVFFLAYLYFEGAAPLNSVRRRAAWIMMHLPWLLSVILLLEGVKNQLLLSSYLGSVYYIISGISDTIGIQDKAQLNATMRPLLLQAGLSFDQEYAGLVNMINFNLSHYENLANETAMAFTGEITKVWYLKIQLSATLNTYLTFMDNDTIPDTIYSTIRRYQNDYNYTLEDITAATTTNTPELPHYGQIWEQLLKPSISNARYIMAMCGTTFIFLASLNLIQAWPRDRFHWASIFSRYATGTCMLLLLLLNIGSVQVYVGWSDEQLARRAGIFQWIDA
ncbi:unnamed protein product [Rhizoctonia solani]|uniref:Uncharacterized protein n=1 Tax=Rhizoctonia solani TaxID=456999 RepID=A0A8H2XYB1_9AGAM|nr:unnamed protein product [Rhizoctonia solani]